MNFYRYKAATRPSHQRGISTLLTLCLMIVLTQIILITYLLFRFLPDEPVTYNTIESHFKYGSLGGERNLGIPYWLWRAMPTLCENKLPNKKSTDIGFESLGMIYEGDNTLPVGVSSRRHLGLDRVFLNCAVCHTSTYQIKPSDEALVVNNLKSGNRHLVLGMPANRFDIMGFQQFFFQCVNDAKFKAKELIPLVQRLGANLDIIDQYFTYPLAIWLTQERLKLVEQRLSLIYQQPEYGPGRVDTFNSAKAVFNWDWQRANTSELIGITDFPSIWLQGPRKSRDDGKPMDLHWDGNNNTVEERNLSAAFGAGGIPPYTDHQALGKIEDWLLTLEPPTFPFVVDIGKANKGKKIYQNYCASCHGKSGRDFTGERVGHVEPIESIDTDRWRLDSYTQKLALNQSMLYAGDERYRFKNFKKTHGYANAPLDGIWLRAPYLHNGSVPTLWALLQPATKRPVTFYRGNDMYDPKHVGFIANQANNGEEEFFLYDTTVDGNSNQGHEGKQYGTDLSNSEKYELIEYLKTF
ncbi:c-type cytochrome [Flocculibacter collagenilyticus]|uniref:c-type cytochrome n=1 Tax=Flocculibacter collagenilyticus TaxID=2744479 RepID=UPI0018F4B3AF|nr:cytochrome c [Flocculibacter collagenilyticus]